MKRNLYTIDSTCFIKIKENSSTYFSYIYKIDSKEDFNYRFNLLKNEHPISSHICYAYRYYHQNIFHEYSSDAGEPSGTAGLQILNVLKRNNIVNIVLFVIRYFGGKKLGIPGLIDVYSKTSELLIDKTNAIKWYDAQKYRIEFAYNLETMIFSILKREKIIILEKIFDKNITLLVSFEKNKIEEIKRILKQSTNGKILILDDSDS